MAIERLGFTARGRTVRELRRALAGGDPLMPPDAALYQVAHLADLLTRTRLLLSVLRDPGQSSLVRQTAALHLGKIEKPAALTGLRRSLRIGDPLVRGAVLRALGLVGGPDDLPRVRRLPGLKGWVGREARFAATLLAHRHGIDGYGVHPVGDGFLDPDSRRFTELRIGHAAHDDREALARSIAVEPLGVPVAVDCLSSLICGPRHMLLVLNRELVEGAEKGSVLTERWRRPALAALVLHRHHDDRTFVPIFYLLTDPAPRSSGRVDLAVLGAGGRLCCLGSATIKGRQARFSMRAVANPGNIPVRIEGTFAGGVISLAVARVGLAVPRARVVGTGPG
ncbi:MAG: HEAT repeat domain-containing protein [Gemmatimonadales bacterium]